MSFDSYVSYDVLTSLTKHFSAFKAIFQPSTSDFLILWWTVHVKTEGIIKK